MSDIVERLRIGGLRNELEAADEITALRAEIERLRAALRPFGCKCSIKGEGAGGTCTRGSGECDYWNARAALKEDGDD